jgi:hypothetical protein
MIQTTSVPVPAAWVNISTNVANAAGLIQFTDSNAAHFPSRFYRAVGQ